MQKALQDLRGQLFPNISATADKYGVARSTLGSRFRDGTVSVEEAHQNYLAHLSKVQEQGVIRWIQKLIATMLPPTPFMIIRYVKSMLKRKISSEWVTRFIKRNEKQLREKWLSEIDRMRVQIEMTRECYKIWFNNVRSKQRSHFIIN